LTKSPGLAIVGLCVGLTLAVGSMPAAGSAAPAGGASAAKRKCAPKRVTKRRTRHSRVRPAKALTRTQAKRTRRCKRAPAPVPAPGIPQPAPQPPPAADPPPAAEEEAPSNRLAVKAGEFYYVLSRPSVSAGEVTVELNNYGEDPHNLNLQRQDGEAEPVLSIPVTGATERDSATFDLPAGSYRLWCSLPTHDAKGMNATLVVE
jgi:plastocyanin